MKHNIGNAGFVEVIDKMGTDLTVSNAARVSFQKRKEKLDDKDVKLIEYLAKHEHHSPFRHCYVTFHVKAPEAVARQWYKHIVGSNYTFPDTGWNEVSGRYVEYEPEFYVPKEFRKQSEDKKQGSSEELIKDNVDVFYQDMMNIAYEGYKRLLKRGVCKEQARMILPTALYTEWYWTASLQAIKHFVNLRKEGSAQKEIQEYAILLDKIMKDLYPISWLALNGEKDAS